MGLFGMIKEKKERKKVKSNVDRIMKAYSDGEIDGNTFFNRMMDYTTSYHEKKKK